MTSKLRKTIVGVGIALGGAAPACFGRTDVVGDFPAPGEDEGTELTPDAGAPGPRPADAGRPDRVEPGDGGPSVPDASDGAMDAATDAADASDGAMDAATDAPIDPFCDVSWPPTKGNDFFGPVACVDPLDECKFKQPPYRCYRLIEPGNCDQRETRVGPLYCIGGEWRCPPGTDDGSRCSCFGPLLPGQTCTDAGPM